MKMSQRRMRRRTYMLIVAIGKRIRNNGSDFWTCDLLNAALESINDKICREFEQAPYLLKEFMRIPARRSRR